jgi:hypothetical protein
VSGGVGGEFDTSHSSSDQSLAERLASEMERWASENERLKTTLANLLATELADVLPDEAPGTDAKSTGSAGSAIKRMNRAEDGTGHHSDRIRGRRPSTQ